MQERVSGFPDLESLTRALSQVFNENRFAAGNVTVVNRRPNVYTSTYQSEIVTCRLKDGRTLKIFCKYGSYKYRDPRGGIHHEARVYRNILQLLRVSSPFFYGTYDYKKGDDKWLFVEYLDHALRLNKTDGVDPIIQAAGWIGRFHAATATDLPDASKEFLPCHDQGYYRGLTRRALLMSKHFRLRFAWLPSLCKQFDKLSGSLLPCKQTVIHGEYYPHNILYQDGRIRPVDWQTAAIAAGEIDLATLTDNWPPEVVLECEHEYQRARWPERVKDDFLRDLSAARLYVQFCLLGSRAEWKKHGDISWRFERLKIEGERLGLI